MSTAAVHDKLTSFSVSYLSESFGSLLSFKSLVSSFRPRNAVFNGVRNSCEM